MTLTIIQQLHPDEALILSHLAEHEKLDAWIIESIWEGRSPLLETIFKEVCIRAQVVNIENSDTYLDNLVRLKLFSRELSTETTFNNAHSDDAESYINSYKKETYEWVVTTSFGRAFIKACIEPQQVKP